MFLIAAAWSSYLGFQDVALFGFPDGHITDYQRASAPVLAALSAALIPLALYFLAVTMNSALFSKTKRWYFFAAVTVILIQYVIDPGVPWYFGTHLALDNGVGG